MDWTGGSRKRFAAKGNAMLQKQKAHFAKVRATTQNAPSSQHTFKPDFLRDSRPSFNRKQTLHDSMHKTQNQGEITLAKEHAPSGQIDKRGSSSHETHAATMRQPPTGPAEVVSVSSRVSSSAYQSSPSEHRHHSGKEDTYVLRPPSGVSEEEALLLANRRRLLARSDWLGLSAVRPVRMNFSASHDKDRVGKRRKVQKTGSQKAKPAGQRLLTPLFEDRMLFGRDQLMHGAIPDEESIRIKIGTDALASQTQPSRSRRSHTPAHTSARATSTEFGPLSEESMLLGADGDTFELERPPLSAPHPDLSHAAANGQHPAESCFAVAGSQITYLDQQSLEIPESTINAREYGNTDQHGHVHKDVPEDYLRHDTLRSDDDCQIANSDSYFRRPEALQSAKPSLPYMPVLGRTDGTSFRPMTAVADMGQPQQSFFGTAEPSASESINDDAAGEKSWKRLLGIKTHSSSNASLAALRSSSQHITTSDSSRRPALESFNVMEKADSADRFVSTPQGAGTQGSMLRETERSDNSQEQSPSASLKQIIMLTEQPALLSAAKKEEKDDNALWRDFIIGSGDSDDECSQPFGVAKKHRQIDREAREPSGPPSFAVSGLGTSEKATVGETLFVTGSTPSVMDKLLGQRKIELSSETAPTYYITKSSMQVQPDAQSDPEDDIEDSPTRPVQKRRQSILHTHRTTSVVGGHRKYKAPKQSEAASRQASRQQLARHKTRVTRMKQSVYDLVDSDGMSLA